MAQPTVPRNLLEHLCPNTFRRSMTVDLPVPDIPVINMLGISMTVQSAPGRPSRHVSVLAAPAP